MEVTCGSTHNLTNKLTIQKMKFYLLLSTYNTLAFLVFISSLMCIVYAPFLNIKIIRFTFDLSSQQANRGGDREEKMLFLILLTQTKTSMYSKGKPP
jgi:hypothetical protein